VEQEQPGTGPAVGWDEVAGARALPRGRFEGFVGHGDQPYAGAPRARPDRW
jgi:hypothetical protein